MAIVVSKNAVRSANTGTRQIKVSSPVAAASGADKLMRCAASVVNGTWEAGDFMGSGMGVGFLANDFCGPGERYSSSGMALLKGSSASRWRCLMARIAP